MATPLPPFGATAPPMDSAQPAAEETQPCPVCQGMGEVPASMSREEMLETLAPPVEESQPRDIPPSITPSRTPAMSEEQTAEVSRLGDHAKDRMKQRNFGY